MKKICPVCELPVNELNYCSRCRRVVRRPLLWKSDYYLNENPPAFERDPGFDRTNGAGDQRKNTPSEPQKRVQPVYNKGTNLPAPSVSQGTGRSSDTSKKKAERNVLASAAGIIAFVLFLSVNVVPTAIEALKRGMSLPENYETAFSYEESGYTEFSEEEVIAAGERCTGYDHFPVDGIQIADSMWEYLGSTDYGYQVDLRDIYSDNYLYQEEEGPKSYYEIIESFSLEDEISSQMDPYDEDYIYQYVEVGYDTATGELHDYFSSLINKEASLDYLEEFLRLTEAEAGISQEESSIPAIMEQAQAGVLQENGAFILEGLFNINIYQSEDTVRIYVAYNNPQVTEDQEI